MERYQVLGFLAGFLVDLLIFLGLAVIPKYPESNRDLPWRGILIVGALISAPGAINGGIGATIGFQTGRHRHGPVLVLPFILFVLGLLFAAMAHLTGYHGLLYAILVGIFVWIPGRLGQQIGDAGFSIQPSSLRKEREVPAFDPKRERGLFLGPIAFGLIGASLGNTWVMVYRAFERGHVYVEDCLLFAMPGLFFGVILGSSLEWGLRRHPRLQSITTILVLTLLGLCVAVPIGWIFGQNQWATPQPRRGMFLGAICGGGLGLAGGLVQWWKDRRSQEKVIDTFLTPDP